MYAISFIQNMFCVFWIFRKNACCIDVSNCAHVVQVIYFFLIIAGCTWRWNKAGEIASGEFLEDQSAVEDGMYDDTYLIKSGKFMKIWLII